MNSFESTANASPSIPTARAYGFEIPPTHRPTHIEIGQRVAGVSVGVVGHVIGGNARYCLVRTGRRVEAWSWSEVSPAGEPVDHPGWESREQTGMQKNYENLSAIIDLLAEIQHVAEIAGRDGLADITGIDSVASAVELEADRLAVIVWPNPKSKVANSEAA